MPKRRIGTPAQQQNTVHRARRHAPKQRNRERGPAAALAAALQDSAQRFDDLPMTPGYRSAEDRW